MKAKKTPPKKRTMGRPRGVTMPCGWCGEALTATTIRPHFTACPKRPERAYPAELTYRGRVYRPAEA